jgi:VIT1/CCC1 family predicted Fe2+/Mn2+ transporter
VRLRSTVRVGLRPLALGLSDGLLNALVLAAGAVLNADKGVTIGLAARVSAVAFVTGMVMFFIGEYAQLRADLVRAEHQLNMTRSGRLATGALGRRARVKAAAAAGTASVASFIGALLPLLVGALIPALRVLPLVLSVLALGGLGAILARAVNGNPLLWALGMLLCGAAAAAVGVELNIT